MKKVAGLSVLCFLFFGNVHAGQDGSENKNEYSVKSWSINMEQHGDEPIQVRTERKESNENGVVLHEKTSGIIDKNGRFIKNEEKPQPRVQQKEPRRWWRPFSRDDEAIEEVRAPEHWKDHARQHPGLPPCNQTPNVEVPKCPEPRTSACPENKNCWKKVQPRNQTSVCDETEDSRPVRFDRRRHRNRIDPCDGAPNPRHIVVHSCEFGDNEDSKRGRRFATVPQRRAGVCPLEQRSESISNQRNYQEPRYQDADRQPVEKVAAPRIFDPWGFSDNFFRTWQEFENQFNEFYRER